MVNAIRTSDYELDCELDYEVDFRDLSTPSVKYEVTSRERFLTCARHKHRRRINGRATTMHRRRTSESEA